MMLMSGIRLSGDQIQKQIATSVDLIVHSELSIDGVRRITNITDLRYDKVSGQITLEDVFVFKQDRVDEATGKVFGDWVMSHKLPSFAHKFTKRNIRLPQEFLK